MKRSDFVCLSALSALAATPAGGAVASTPALPSTIAGVTIPDSYLARQATQQARDVEADHVFRHSVRSFVFAELISRARKVKHDPELVYISCILHDIGLSELYRANQPSNSMAFFIGVEIYDHLETVVDRFDDVGNEISGIVIENV